MASDQTPPAFSWTDIGVGASVAVAGNFLISVSYVLQRHAHLRGGKGGRVYRSWQWALGLVCMGPGELGNAYALSRAPPRLVAGLGCFTVMFNVLLACKFLGEAFTRRIAVGASLCVAAGLMFVVSSTTVPTFGSVEQLMEQLRQTPFLVYIFVVLSASLFGLLVTWFVPVVFVMGAYGLVCILTTACATRLLQLYGWQPNSVASSAQLWLCAVAAVFIALQAILFQRAVSRFTLNRFIPAHYAAYNTLSATGATLLFGAGAGAGWRGMWAAYCVGLVAAGAGVLTLVHALPTPDAAYTTVGAASEPGSKTARGHEDGGL